MQLTCSSVTLAECAAVARLLYADQAPAQQDQSVADLLARVVSGQLQPQDFLVAKRDGEIQAALLMQPLAGNVASFWPPRARPGCEQAADFLAQYALIEAQRQGFLFGQCLLSFEDLASAAPLLRNGFRWVTRLQVHKHFLNDLPALDTSLEFRPFVECDPNLFCDVLLAANEETLDCPELDHLRNRWQTCDAFRISDEPPAVWFLAYRNNQPVGVVLVNPLESAGSWELAYLGLAKPYRGQGLGRQLISFALHQSHRRGATSLRLYVDSRNRPAIRLYESVGFVWVQEWDLLLAIWSEPSPAPPCSVASVDTPKVAG